MALFHDSVCLVRASVMLTLAIAADWCLAQDQPNPVACASCQSNRACEDPGRFCEHQLAYKCFGLNKSYFSHSARQCVASASRHISTGETGELQPKPTDTPCPTSENSANKREEKFERFEFAAPAYFPLSDYDSCGMQYQRPGLVILEGMALTFEPGSSQYELTFEYEVPAVPVELRLQLMVHRAPCPANKEHTNDWFTITIPVTRLEAGRSDSPSVMQARIKGNSVALKHLCHLESSTTERQSISLELKRRGTARFGHGFDRVDRAIARQ